MHNGRRLNKRRWRWLRVRRPDLDGRRGVGVAVLVSRVGRIVDGDASLSAEPDADDGRRQILLLDLVAVDQDRLCVDAALSQWRIVSS